MSRAVGDLGVMKLLLQFGTFGNYGSDLEGLANRAILNQVLPSGIYCACRGRQATMMPQLSKARARSGSTGRRGIAEHRPPCGKKDLIDQINIWKSLKLVLDQLLEELAFGRIALQHQSGMVRPQTVKG